jgi:ATP-dependent helicase HepA
MNEFAKGQRWVSGNEPELGLGIVKESDRHHVRIAFPAAGEERMYAVQSAPLRRVEYHVGDVVFDQAGIERKVIEVIRLGACFQYLCEDGIVIDEENLADSTSFSKTEDRLRAASVDPNRAFSLRLQTLHHLSAARRLSVAGFLGGRIDLIPHQLYIADEVANRYHPRVLLADEVGLGKTIEACLILHRLILTGRITRALILVPEPLLHQWFVELLRRFNLWFTLFDSDRYADLGAEDWQQNPFLGDQLILCGTRFLASNQDAADAAVEAGWDMLVVDEAHHLQWSPESVSVEYQLVERIAEVSEGLMLLTATPEQLGISGHYARLRLLDPGRYPSLKQFLAEQKAYHAAAGIVDTISSGKQLNASQTKKLRSIFAEMTEADFASYLENLHSKVGFVAEKALLELVDRHGTGRVIFRNTREQLVGFPERKAILQPLHPRAGMSREQLLEQLLAELDFDDLQDGQGTGVEIHPPDYRNGVRLHWLLQLLDRLGASEKVLLICRSHAKVLAIEAALKLAGSYKVAVFHEDMSLIQRDRGAAWFSDPDGARVLICSEIGSEGRNFQFAHHLVLFDLPLDPELLEQRIGRLDRIGQTETVRIYLPYVEGSCVELLAHWHHDGLDGVEHSLRGGAAYLDAFGEKVVAMARRYHEKRKGDKVAVNRLIRQSRKFRDELEEQLKRGQSRLLALNSYREHHAARVVDAIAAIDADPQLDQFMNLMFDQFGIIVEDISPGTYKLKPGPYLMDSLPGLAQEGTVATIHREIALAREDVAFLTWDHPMVRGAMDALLASGRGNCAFVHVISDRLPEGVYLEAIYVLECIAPAALHMDRFLPPTPIRVVVDLAQRDVSEELCADLIDAAGEDGEAYRLKEQPGFLRQQVPEMLRGAQEFAAARKSSLIASAVEAAHCVLDDEVRRLEALSRVNENVRQSEIDTAKEYLTQVLRHLTKAQIRLDATRLIVAGE